MDENKLIQSCLQGNVEDFKGIVEMYKGKAMAFAVNILGNREDAEDACQDAFIRIYNNLDKFDSSHQFKDWMYAILHNRCMDFLRKKKRFIKYFDGQKAGLREVRKEDPGSKPAKKELRKYWKNSAPRSEQPLFCGLMSPTAAARSREFWAVLPALSGFIFLKPDEK